MDGKVVEDAARGLKRREAPLTRIRTELVPMSIPMMKSMSGLGCEQK